MKLIIGLGNPGKDYEKTRHNIGFMALDEIARAFRFEDFKMNEKFESEIATGNIGDIKIILVKPQTFMNSSGRAVQKIINFYKIDLKDLIVIHDDLDINAGDFRLAFDSRSAGHKGVQSIIDLIGSKEFNRIRIGIKIENQKVPTEKFVLSNFSKNEKAKTESVISELPRIIEKELV
jgi:PTH1 family peptidyl-tRNA hydrolase